MRNDKFTQAVKNEIPYPQLSLRGDAAFVAAYNRLPEKKTAAGNHFAREVHGRGEKKEKKGLLWKLPTGAVAASLVLLVGINFAAPTLAESIPGLGLIFQSINSKHAIGRNLPTYDGLVKSVGVSQTTEECTVSVREAYSEGRYAYASLELTSQDEKINSAQWLTPDYWQNGKDAHPDYEITVNGEQTDFFDQVFFTKQSATFQAPVVITLPKEAENGEKLQIQMTFHALRGLKNGTERRADTQPEVEITSPVTLDFEVIVDASKNTENAPNAEDEGVTLLSYESTPTYFNVTLQYPALYGDFADSTRGDYGWVTARTEDGTELSRNSTNTEWAGGSIRPGEIVSPMTAFEGVPAGTKKVIVTLETIGDSGMMINLNGAWVGSYVLAEFTLDLETGQAMPSTSYLEKGLPGITIDRYLEAFPKGSEFTGHTAVSRLYWSSSLRMMLSSDGDFVDLEENQQNVNNLTLDLYQDVDETLPLELKVYEEGTLSRIIPVLAENSSAALEGAQFSVGENYFILQEQERPENEFYQRAYQITVLFPDSEVSSEEISMRIINTETGAILWNSQESPSPQDLTELA